MIEYIFRKGFFVFALRTLSDIHYQRRAARSTHIGSNVVQASDGWTAGRTEDWWKRLQLWSHYSTSERSWKSGRTGTQQRAKPCQRLLIGQTSFLLVYFAFSFVNAFAQNIRPGIERSPANACVLHSFRNFLYGKSEQLLNWLAIIFSPSFLIIIMPRKIGLATRVSWFVIPQLVSFSSTGYVSVFEPFSCRCETS